MTVVMKYLIPTLLWSEVVEGQLSLIGSRKGRWKFCIIPGILSLTFP